MPVLDPRLSRWTSSVLALAFNAACTLAATTCVAAPAAHTMVPGTSRTGTNLLFSPYKYVPRYLDPTTHALETAITGFPIPLVGSGGLLPKYLPDLHAVTLAFVTGECGKETWHGVPRQAVADTAIPMLAQTGIDYVISSGGEGAKFTCATPAAFVRFVRRYLTPHMLGVDFDIEYNQTPGEIKALVADAAFAQGKFPNLRFSFTIATWAGSNGSHNGINKLGATVVQAIKASKLSHYTIDLMVMDYGKTSAQTCVLADGRCEMGLSAIRAAKNLEHTWGIPAGRIELTPIAGVNDNKDEIFTLADMDTMVHYAVDHGLAGIHFWSLDRDTPCRKSRDKMTAIVCSGTHAPPLAYTRRALRDLGR